jgi:hypothetical protein
MRTRSSWIWYWIVGAVLASGAGAQQYTTIIDNLPTCTGNRNGRVISVSDAVSDADCTEGGATGEDRFVHPCICDTLNALGPYWKAVGGGAGSSGPADALAPAVVIEGTTADAFEGNFTFADPTADWTWAWDATGSAAFPQDALVSRALYVGGVTTGTAEWVADQSKFHLGSSMVFGWASAGTPEGASYVLDTQFTREEADVVKLDSVLELTPVASGGTCDAGNEGRIYTDTSHALCYCDAATWQVLNPLTAGVGTCE